MTSNAFYEYEVRSKRAAPLIGYLLASSQKDTDEANSGNLFTLFKGRPGEFAVHADAQSSDVIDESFINDIQFLNLIRNGVQKPAPPKKVTVVGAGVSGLCTAYELRRAGFEVSVLEASSRVGGRVITFRDPVLAPGLHAEGGAMRIPSDHYLLREYIKRFGLEDQLFAFEMKSKVIHLSGMPEDQRTMTYTEFDAKLKKRDSTLLSLFPGLREEKGKTCDDLFDAAVEPVKQLWSDTYKAAGGTDQEPYSAAALTAAYKAITDVYDKYTLRSYLTDVAGWSDDAISLYDLGNAHVVFENGFIESFKDAFLSSNKAGTKSGMQQLQSGMDAVPKTFFTATPATDGKPLSDSVIFGARVKRIQRGGSGVGVGQSQITCYYDGPSGEEVAVTSDFLVLSIPYTSQRSIAKSEAFTPKREMAIRDVRYVEVTKVILQYSQRWWVEIFKSWKQGTDGGVVCDLPVRYTMFPKEDGNSQTANDNPRGAIMAAYTFQQDATNLGSLSPERRIAIAARNLDTIFPNANSLKLLEAGTSQVFPADELAGGSAFCYFGPLQKTKYLETMCSTDWANTVFFAGEHASYTHGWIQGALEAALRCTLQIYDATSRDIA